MSVASLDLPNPATKQDLIEAAKKEGLSIIPAVWTRRRVFGAAGQGAKDRGADLTQGFLLIEDAALDPQEVALWVSRPGARKRLPDYEPFRETWSQNVTTIVESAELPILDQPDMDFFENFEMPAPRGEKPIAVFAGPNPEGEGYIVSEAA